MARLTAAGERPSLRPAGKTPLIERGDQIECGVDGVGTLKVAIGKPE